MFSLEQLFVLKLFIIFLSDCTLCANPKIIGEAYGISQSQNTELDSRASGQQETDQSEMSIISLPKKLEPGDTFMVSGPMSDETTKLSCLLMKGRETPDYNNTFYRFEANFPNSGVGNFMTVQVIRNGVAETVPGGYQNDVTTESFGGDTYELAFKTFMRDPGDYRILITINNSNDIAEITIELEDLEAIKFISVTGQPIKKFEYLFAD